MIGLAHSLCFLRGVMAWEANRENATGDGEGRRKGRERRGDYEGEGGGGEGKGELEGDCMISTRCLRARYPGFRLRNFDYLKKYIGVGIRPARLERRDNTRGRERQAT